MNTINITTSPKTLEVQTPEDRVLEIQADVEFDDGNSLEWNGDPLTWNSDPLIFTAA